MDEVDGLKLKIKYGNLKNAAVGAPPAAHATDVTFDITYNILNGRAAGECDACISAKIGGQDLTLPKFDVTENVSNTNIRTEWLNLAR